MQGQDTFNADATGAPQDKNNGKSKTNATKPSTSGNGSKGFGSGDDEPTDKENTEVEYPTLGYKGQGRIDTRAGWSNIFQSITVKTDADKVTLTVDSIRSDDSEKKS